MAVNMTLFQYQEYVRRTHKLEGRGIFLQQELFKKLRESALFDNINTGTGAFMQDVVLTDAQMQELNIIKQEVLNNTWQAITRHELEEQMKDPEMKQWEFELDQKEREKTYEQIEFDMNKLGIKWGENQN